MLAKLLRLAPGRSLGTSEFADERIINSGSVQSTRSDVTYRDLSQKVVLMEAEHEQL